MDESDLIFSIEEGSDRFLLEPLASADSYGYVNFSASVSALGFTGENTDICCDLRDLNRFFNELVELEQKRQGSAMLESVSTRSEYNELFFQVYSIDRGGNMAVDVVIQKIRYLGGKIALLKVSASFAIDPGKMTIIVRDFRKLLKFVNKPAV